MIKRKSLLFTRAITVFALLFLGYGLGFFSASTSNPSPSSSDQALVRPNPAISVESVIKEEKPDCSTQKQREDAAEQNPRPQQPPRDFFDFRTQCAPPLNQTQILPTLLKHVYDGKSPFSGFPPPHAAPLLRHRRVRGWGSTAPVFQALIDTVRPKTIIEIGTFMGASALHMANVTRALGLADTVILCLDDFRGWPGFRRGAFRDVGEVNGDVMLMYQFMQNVVDAGEEGRVLPVPFSTGSGLAGLCELGVYGDLVEVDAGHDFHSAWADINMAWALVRPGGVMFGHDYNLAADRRGVRRAVDLFAKVKGLRVRPSGQHWVLLPQVHQQRRREGRKDKGRGNRRNSE